MCLLMLQGAGGRFLRVWMLGSGPREPRSVDRLHGMCTRVTVCNLPSASCMRKAAHAYL